MSRIKETVFGLTGRLPSVNLKRLVTLNIPYVIVFYLVDKTAWLYRHCMGGSPVEKLGVLFLNFQLAFTSCFPSFHLYDLAAMRKEGTPKSTGRAWNTVPPGGAIRRT